MRVLLIEDDQDLGSSLQLALTGADMTCDWLKDSESAEYAALNEAFDVIILDWMLPGRDGVSFLKWLRQKKLSIPIMMLTANVSTENKVEGLNSGADDYLTKPFELDELIARVKALARRAVVRPDNTLVCGRYSLDADNSILLSEDGEIALSSQESRVLHLLMSNCGRYISKNRIEEYISGWGEPNTQNAVEAQISRLRKKIGKSAIVTLRGIGYKFNND